LLGLSEAIKEEGSQPERAEFLHVIKPAMSFAGFIYFGNEDFFFYFLWYYTSVGK